MTHLKENKDACIEGQTGKPATAQHAWMKTHPVTLGGKTIDLEKKELFCTQSIPQNAIEKMAIKYRTAELRCTRTSWVQQTQG